VQIVAIMAAPRLEVLSMPSHVSFAPEDTHKSVHINHTRAILAMSRLLPTSKSSYLHQMAETWLAKQQEDHETKHCNGCAVKQHES